MAFWLTWAAIAYLYIGGSFSLYAFAMDQRILIRDGDGWRNWIKWHRPKLDRDDGIRPMGYVLFIFWPVAIPFVIFLSLIVSLGRWLESKGVY